MLLHLWILIGPHMLSSYATSQTWYNMPRKFMPMKAKQRQNVGGTNSLINTLLVVLHNGVKNIHVRKAWLLWCAIRTENSFEHVYIRPEVNSNRFKISDRFEMLLRLHCNLHGDFTAAIFPTIAKLYCTCANDIFKLM